MKTETREASYGGGMLRILQETIRRVDPFGIVNDGKPDELTLGDRTFIASILRMIAADTDPRDLFFEGAAKLGRPPVTEMRLAVAVDVAISRALGEKEEVAKLKAQEKSGQSAPQVERALREHYAKAEAFIASMNSDRLQTESRVNDERIEKCRKSK